MDDLQFWRETAHHYFDGLWRYTSYRRGGYKRKYRNSKYKWLSKQLDLTLDESHMRNMDIETCKKVVNICAEEYIKNPKLMKFVDDKGVMKNNYKNESRKR